MSQFDRSELVSLAEYSFDKKLYNDVISYMKEVLIKETPLNFEERALINDSYMCMKDPFVKSYNSCHLSNLDEKLREGLQTKAKTAINRICDEANELLDSYWVKRDNSKEAVADYTGVKAFQYHSMASIASG